jgi:drug/metabolite transporter (DMT)-like permease
MPIYLTLALIAAIAYSIGSLFNKQAMAGGCGLYRVTAVTIWSTSLLLIPFALANHDPLPLHLWAQPLITSVFFCAGSVFFMLALRTGDLSIVAPVSGLKPIMNALLVAAWLGTSVPVVTWIACGLSALALIVLRTPNASTQHSFLRTALITLTSSLCFALCDTCFQQWAGAWGVFRFGAITFSIGSVVALALIPLFGQPWRELSRTAKNHILIGGAFCACPGLCMSLALGRYGHAAEVNVAYSSRALFSILAVRYIGKLIGSSEQHAPKHIFLRRLAGALILLLAIGLILSASL